MIHELRTYTLQPGTQAKYLQLSGEVGRKIRGDKYGKQEGFWFTEFGTLNQLVHLWSFPDLNERDRLRGLLAKDEAWNKEYIPQIRGMLLAQENKILSPVLPLNRPARRGVGVRAALVPLPRRADQGVARPLQGGDADAGEAHAPGRPLADRHRPAQ